MELSPKFIQIDQYKWVHLDTIRVIEYIDEKYYLWITNHEGKCLKVEVDKTYTDVEVLLKYYTFQPQSTTSSFTNLLD
jgi:hypothetical protein